MSSKNKHLFYMFRLGTKIFSKTKFAESYLLTVGSIAEKGINLETSIIISLFDLSLILLNIDWSKVNLNLIISVNIFLDLFIGTLACRPIFGRCY